MKRICTASLAFKKETPEDKVAFGTNVINMLGPTPPPVASKLLAKLLTDLPVPVADLEDVNNRLWAANGAAKSGAFVDVEALANVVTEWNQDFTLTANFITTMAAGNPEIIRAAGFVPTKTEAQKQPAAGATTDFVAHTNGKKGAIVARAKKKVSLAKAYVFSAVPDGVEVSYAGNVMVLTVGDKNIYVTAHTKKNVELYNLPSGVKYNVSMYGFNSAGSGGAAPSQQVIPQ